MSTRSLQTGKERYPCPKNGCQRSFARKEHLSRHEAQHSSSSTQFLCQVCLREFNRSDSLQRHMVRHGEGYRKEPSGRSKKACSACHTSKTKCDGNSRCARCTRKDIECVYEQQEGEQPPAPQPNESVVSRDLDSLKRSPPIPLEPPSANLATQQALDPLKESPGQMGVQWVLSSRVENTIPCKLLQDDGPSLITESALAGYMELYFKYFHHRWPIIHAPTYESDGTTILTSSMWMMGAWLYGSAESQEIAVVKHKDIMSQISSRLSQITSLDTFQESLPAALCQAALLNIIFGLYCGEEKIMSKAHILQSTLVAVLREVGFFTREIPYDKPNTMQAFRQVRNGERQRLAAYLFKASSYYTLVRSQPSSLTPSDLHFNIPTTYALCNGDGLHVWELRNSIEPPSRQNITLASILLNPPFDTNPIDGLMLIEDIQLGLCALHYQSLSLDPETLACYKSFLDRHTFHRSPEEGGGDEADITRETHMFMRFYYGLESHSVPNWRATVLARLKDLYADALILYHLSALTLHAPIPALRQLARDIISDYTPYGAAHRHTSATREGSIRTWTSTPAARRALCHCADIISSFRQDENEDRRTRDPIAYAALSVAALVIWGYCIYGTHICVDSAIMAQCAEFAVVELEGEEGGRKAWVDGEWGVRIVMLGGTQVCLCKMALLVEQLQSLLPVEWAKGVARSIAPGVFRDVVSVSG